ncbi:hypothetical protein H6F86_20700 [Phormidium sp. FACHB-592]|uniref:Uncharacterized protein n=1 Tax=Stenomitos frigidus AS-A4 TaxID=2933935 RepID=A0ABV0KF39_9CYAN|nr:hypothetical protein [Phormidium sp. FACHB-592]MBD2076253.1 hypothetical protein [Phormidium sp. FACHB-592]
MDLKAAIAQALATQQETVIGRALRLGRPGDTIDVSIPNSNATIRARCATEVNSGTVTVVKTLQGAWAFCSTAPQTVVNLPGAFLKVRPKLNPVLTGQIKILFSRVIDGDLVFFIGGDRETPDQIFTLPLSANIRASSLTNTGVDADDWVVGIAWRDGQDAGLEPLTTVVNLTPAREMRLGASRENSYLEARGSGFWSSPLIASSTINPLIIGAIYGETSTSSESGTPSNATYTLLTPTVLSGSLNSVTNGTDINNQTSLTTGSSSNKGFAFWDQAIAVAVGNTDWNRSQIIVNGLVVDGLSDNRHTGSVYVAPDLQKAATTIDRTTRVETVNSQTFTEQRRYDLWETYLCGDQRALVISRIETIDREVNNNGVVRNISTGSFSLVSVDRSGNLPDAPLSQPLSDLLLVDRRNDSTFNLVGDVVWEADINNRNNDPSNSNFFNAIKQGNVELSVNEYDLNSDMATPTTTTSNVFKLVDDNSLQIIAASYHP